MPDGPERPDQVEQPSWPNLFDERIAAHLRRRLGRACSIPPWSARRSTSWPAWPVRRRARVRHRHRAASRCRLSGAWRPGPGDRPVARHGGAAAGEARRRGDRSDGRGLATDQARRDLPARLPRVQHDREPHHPGRRRWRASATWPPTSNRAAASSLRSRCRQLRRLPPGDRRRRSPSRRRGWDSTPSTSPASWASRTTTGSGTAGPRRSPCRTATCGRPSSTSWRASPACACASAGRLGPRAVHQRELEHVSVWEKVEGSRA